jgi:Ca2+-binding RTX toxin-like protein
LPNTVTYTESLAATGTDNFTCQVSDGNGGTDTARVDIIIDNPPTNFIVGSGDDTLTTGLSNDVIDGALGSDSVIFSSEKSAYSITEGGKNVVITYSQEGRNGSDTLSSIENFQFLDGSFQLSELLDVTEIDRGTYRFFNVDTGTHFYLKL